MASQKTRSRKRPTRRVAVPRKLADLKPNPRNPRTIAPEALAGLSTSLDEFGDIAGLTWNRRTGRLVTGHQRIEALKMQFGNRLRLRDNAVVTPTGERFPIRVVDWPADVARAAMIAANNAHIAGDWTAELAKLLDELPEQLGDLFQGLRLDQLLSDVPTTDQLAQGLTAPDDVPEPPDEATTRPGDLWFLPPFRRSPAHAACYGGIA